MYFTIMLLMLFSHNEGTPIYFLELLLDWDNWRIKDQLDVACYFISLLMCSTCFGQYIHHQALATVLLNYHIGRFVLGSLCVRDLVWLGWSGVRAAGFILQHRYHSNPAAQLKVDHFALKFLYAFKIWRKTGQMWFYNSYRWIMCSVWEWYWKCA